MVQVGTRVYEHLSYSSHHQGFYSKARCLVNHGLLTLPNSPLLLDTMDLNPMKHSNTTSRQPPTQQASPVQPHTVQPHQQHHTPVDPVASLSLPSHSAVISHHDDYSRYHYRPETPSSASVRLPPFVAATMRKETESFVPAHATATTLGSAETNTKSYSAETSPRSNQSIFSIRGGTDVSSNRRTSRRRTGPLSQQSRERAALIRKLGACPDCRRRRVACHPNHHDMTWEDVVHRFHGSRSPAFHEMASATTSMRDSASPIREARTSFAPDPQDMEIDPGPSTSHHASRHHSHFPSLGEHREQTPLPPGPRLGESFSLPGIETFRTKLQTTANRMLSTANRSRYTEVRALLLVWQDDDDAALVHSATRELADVFEKHYHFSFQIQEIPAPEPGLAKDSWRWLSRTLDRFVDEDDDREILKIVHYTGHTFLDDSRELCLSSSRDVRVASFVRWSTLQQPLEQATSDVLVLMDAAFFPCPRIRKKQGVMEVLAASISDDHAASLGRGTFTRALAEQLRIRAGRAQPLSAVELHALLLSAYPKLVHDRQPEHEAVVAYPLPFHMMTSGNSRLPSVFLTPMGQRSSPLRTVAGFSAESGPQISLTVRLTDDNVNAESWNEWLRLIPETARDVRIEGPFRGSHR